MKFSLKFQHNSSQILKEQFSTSYGKTKEARIPETILNNKNIAGGIAIPDFKLYSRVVKIKTAWYWHKNRHADQRNKIEGPDINLHTYEHLIFDEELRNTSWNQLSY